MKAHEFCYWLQGHFEMLRAGGLSTALTASQSQCIEKHLALVFKHEIDPKYGDEEHQNELNDIHDALLVDNEVSDLVKPPRPPRPRPPGMSGGGGTMFRC